MVTDMKKIKSILILMLAVFAVSCVEKEPDYKDFPSKDVDFTFAVDGDEYTTDFYYVSPINFTNTSAKTGTLTWDFGDGTTSNEANPVHQFAKSGKYNVTLTVAGVGSCTYPIQVMDIVPVVSITAQSDSLVVVNEGTVELGIELPNPTGRLCRYIWEFPQGTINENGEEITTFEGENPGKLMFKNIGSQKITLKTQFDVEDGGENRPLDPSYVNVQVAYTEEVPTIYYASYGGNVKAFKIIDPSTLPAGTKNLPYDMGVSSGVTPQQLVFAKTKDGEYIYILDPGKKFTYQEDTNGVLGDGKITVMSTDGTYANTVITNVGGHAFSDPFQGIAVDNDKDGLHDDLYYTDRNTGVSKIALSSRGVVETRINSNTSSYWVTNQSLGYYNKGISYGAVHSGIQLDSNGVFYWPKAYNGFGIFRFRSSDIGNTDAAPTSVLLSGAVAKAFVIDETRKVMYVWHTGGTPGEGFCQYPLVAFTEGLEAKDYTQYFKMDAALTAGSSVEALHVSQFAVDSANGNVYFGFNPDAAEANYENAIYCYDYAKKTMTKVAGTENEKVFGICINPKKTQLF